MTKKKYIVILLTFYNLVLSQEVNYVKKVATYQKCDTQKCQIVHSFLLAQSYLDTDDIESSQKWISITKSLTNPKTIDTTACYIHSLQSELFYYTGLFQFGAHEANKTINKSLILKDSMMTAEGYFYRGINEFELNQLSKSEKSLLLSKKYYPKKQYKTIKTLIYPEHIFNNLAQVKLKLNQLNEAFFFNKKSYSIAKKTGNRRVIPNAEQTFAEIYLAKKQLDSAIYYFKKSEKSAIKSQYFDITLLNYGFLIQTDNKNSIFWYNKGVKLMENIIVNIAYKKLFYQKALLHFKNSKNNNLVVSIQQKIIDIDTETATKNNLYVQNISNEYVENESKILSLQIQELEKQKNIIYLQLLAAILIVIALILGIIVIRRKNKINQTLLLQKNEISQDLHDDIGSGISSILIHANLLLKNTENIEKQKMLAIKISTTGAEISQRLSTFIWSLNTENNSLFHFIEFIKQYGTNLYEETNIKFIFKDQTENPESYSINGHDRKNLFFCLKEILNNALKYSKASNLTLQIQVIDKKSLIIDIQDNGIGLSENKTLGNGIKNIEKRITQLQGTFIYKNQNGLHTQIKIPIHLV